MKIMPKITLDCATKTRCSYLGVYCKYMSATSERFYCRLFKRVIQSNNHDPKRLKICRDAEVEE